MSIATEALPYVLPTIPYVMATFMILGGVALIVDIVKSARDGGMLR